MMQSYKICRKCGQEKYIDDFHKHKCMKDGHLNVCKKCIMAYGAARRARLGKGHRHAEYLHALESGKRTRTAPQKYGINTESHKIYSLKYHHRSLDHIVPLHHKDACGLHVAANMQSVPAYWNYCKSNKSMRQFWPSKHVS